MSERSRDRTTPWGAKLEERIDADARVGAVDALLGGPGSSAALLGRLAEPGGAALPELQVALERISALLDELSRAREEESQLLTLTTALSSELKLIPLLQKIMDAVRLMLDVERATLFMFDPETQELWTRISRDEAMASVRFPADRGIAGSVFTTGESARLDDVYSDPRFNREIDKQTGYRTLTMLCMPVVSKLGHKIGVIQTLNKRGGRLPDGSMAPPIPFCDRDVERLRAFCAQASIAIENAQLFDEVVRIKNYNESILRSMYNGVVTVDRDGRVVTINGAAQRILCLPGGAPGEARSRAEALMTGPNAWMMDSIEAVRASGREQVAMDAEIALPGEGGGPRHAAINLTAVPLTDAEERRIGALLMMEDITEEKRLKSTMARYMTKEVLDKLLGEGEAALGGKVVKATVLFTDIQGFTTTAERLGPQATVSMLNEYFTAMVDCVLEHGGMLDKYIGDAIMAVFGVPFAGRGDADRAMLAVIAMMKGLRELNRERAKKGHEPIAMRAGINTEEVVSGNIGSLKRMDYTVIGDGVNLASRLEGANRLYGTEVLVSELTVRELEGTYSMREVDRLRVKGKERPVAVHELLEHHDEADFPRRHELLPVYRDALSSYRRGDFTAARLGFQRVLELHPGDGTSSMYVRRCEYFAGRPPPPDWDGVWVMQDK